MNTCVMYILFLQTQNACFRKGGNRIYIKKLIYDMSLDIVISVKMNTDLPDLQSS